MGYFANGTEGDIYEERYCNRCVHRGGCAVYFLHLDWNYEQHKDDPTSQAKAFALDLLIPRDGIENKQCEMFYPEAGHATAQGIIAEAYRRLGELGYAYEGEEQWDLMDKLAELA